MLSAEKLSVGYGLRVVLSDIALEVKPGEVLCLLDPNGAGKTTLFRTLLGLISPLAGEIRLDDKRLAQLTARERAARMAYVPQAHAGVFAYTVLDVVLMGRTAKLGLFASPGVADEAAAHQALATIGIERFAEADYTRISGGERQLVLIARALAQETPLLVLDEPTANLDFGNSARVLSHVAVLAQRGYAVVLSTHEPDHALSIGTHVIVVADGHIAAEGRPAEVLTAARLSATYGVKVEVETTQSGARVARPVLDGKTRPNP
jgi:iron complex transport system ATP-binding protein